MGMYSAVIAGIDLLELNVVTVVFRLLFATVCGAVLGIERLRKRRAAGLRTFILVCTASALIMMTSQFINMAYDTDTDLSRLGAQVISGIGFLGAGTILITGQQKVKGLTTAASLWAVASIGLAIGTGFYLGALILCAIVLVTMIMLDNYRIKLGNKIKALHLDIMLDKKEDFIGFLQHAKQMEIEILDMDVSIDRMDMVCVSCVLQGARHFDRANLLAEIEGCKGVIHVEEL